MLELVTDWLVSPWILAFSLCLFLVLTFLARSKKDVGLNLPPGPKGLPLVGFMPFFDQKNPHIQLDKLRKTYGDVYGMYMGSTYYLILSDLESAKEAFNLESFTCRPDGCFALGDGCTNFASTYGQHWYDHRKLASKCLRQYLLDSEDLETNILNFTRGALDQLEKDCAGHPKGEVNLEPPVTDAVNGISYWVICGRDLASDRGAFGVVSRFQSAFAKHATSISLERSLPWLKPLTYALLPSRRRVYKAFQDMEAHCWSQIEGHEKEPADEPKDFLERYLQEGKKTNNAAKLTRADGNGDAQMLLFASGETVRSTIVWYLMLLAKYPDVQDKVYREIHNYLGSSGVPRYAERSNLPYTEATILESMRYVTLVPLNPVHSTLKDQVTKFRGYDIPGDSVVIANLWSVLNDPKRWAQPDRYYPEHFLSEDGQTVKVPDNFIPFSIGKRICIGDKLALVEVFFFAVCFLQRFQILPPEGGVSFAGKMSVTLEAQHPVVRLAPRNN